MPHFPTPTKKVKAKKIGYLLITSATVNMTEKNSMFITRSTKKDILLPGTRGLCKYVLEKNPKEVNVMV